MKKILVVAAAIAALALAPAAFAEEAMGHACTNGKDAMGHACNAASPMAHGAMSHPAAGGAMSHTSQ